MFALCEEGEFVNETSALMGPSAIIRHVQHLALKVAESNSTILIIGELGTGKDAVARLIHERSARCDKLFFTIKCSSSSEETFEIELFGHTSDYVPNVPQKKDGLLSLAEGGTIYIEEISQLSIRLQGLFLKILKENSYTLLGQQEPTPHNVRIICSNSCELEGFVRKGEFREDLFYKLSSSYIYLPPLRERREDIGVLSEFFIQKYNKLKSKKISGISHDAMKALLQHSWTRNLAELENLIERVVVLKNTGNIDICDLPPRLRNFVTDNIDVFYDSKSSHSNNNSLNSLKISSMNFDKSNPSVSSPGLSRSFNKKPLNSDYPLSDTNYISSSTELGEYRKISSQNHGVSTSSMMYPNYDSFSSNQSQHPSRSGSSVFDEIPSEIDQFIKKEIDLGSGIDFYRVVEEFENKLIAEALRRTNHNKNRAAQLLSMNRTTLVEKLKKRSSSCVKSESSRVKRNSAFTIYDSIGKDKNEIDVIDFISIPGER